MPSESDRKPPVATVTGRQALIEAAQLEQARIYTQRCPEYRRTEDLLTVEVQHFAGFGWSIGRIALKLGLSKSDVHRILGAA